MRELLVQPLALVKTRRQQWGYKNLFPLRVLTIMAGDAGIGKSTILAFFVAGFTRGIFPGDFSGKPVAVGFIAAEDDPETTLVPRLKAADANLELVHNFSTVRNTDEAGNVWSELPKIASDLTALKNSLIENGIRVLIIDPVISIMSGDSIKDNEVRRNLDPIAGLANELDIVVILVMHYNKGPSGGRAANKIAGSHAFFDVARSVLLMAVDEETNHRVISVDKSNYSADSPSLAFSIDTVDIMTDDGDIAQIGRAQHLGDSTITVHEIMNRNEDATLGDISANMVALVKNAAPGQITVKELADALDITQDKARTYAGRLVRSKRITRVSAGHYCDTSVSHRFGVSDVSDVPKNDTFDTPNTHIGNDSKCVVCSNPLADALINQGETTHPTCSTVVTLV